MDIKLYGTKRCHKAHHYIEFSNNRNLNFKFLDVEKNKEFDEELTQLYQNRKLNFPTIMVRNKRLRNPTDKELKKWIEK